MKNLILAFALLLPIAANAADAEAGKGKIATCIACHGANGISIADIYPNLAGQKEAYLVSSIKAYKDGTRSGGMTAMMAPMVGALSDEDIADIAAYFAGL